MQNKDLKGNDPRLIVRNSLRVVVIAIAYFLAHQISFFYPDSKQVLMAVWPAAGFGLAALLLSPRNLWPAILVALFVAGNIANLFAGRPIVNSIGFMTANVLESLTCAWLIIRWCGSAISFTRVKEITALICSAVIVNAFTASIGAGTASLSHIDSFCSFWQTWWVSDGLGILLVTPLIITGTQFLKSVPRVQWNKILEIGLFLSVWTFTAWETFQTNGDIHLYFAKPYIFFALITWCALRFEQLWVNIALIILAILAISGKAVYSFDTLNPNNALLLTQVYLGCVCVTGFLLAAIASEQKRSIASLKDSENFLDTVINENPSPIWISDSSGTLIRINRACCRILNITEKEVVGKYNIFDGTIIHEEGLSEKVRSVFNEGAVVHFEVRYNSSRLKNISVEKFVDKVLSITIFPIFARDGRITNAVIQQTDITDRYREAIAIRKSEEKFSKAFKASPAAISICRISDGKHIDVNDTYLVKTGFQREEVIGFSSTELGFWVEPADRQCYIDTLTGNGFLRDFETTLRIRAGEKRDFLVSSEIIELDNTTCSLNFLLDITDRKRSEQLFKDSQNRLAMAVVSAHLGIWDWDITNDKLLWDDQMFRLYGVTEKPATCSLETWKKGLHPDDIASTWNASLAALRGEKDYDVEFRVKHPDGTIRHIKANGLVLRDAAGNAVRMIGVNHDITDRKIAEQEHLKLELQIQQTQKLESLGVLAGGIAHDFNNLMGGIFGYIELASDESEDVKVTKYLSKAIGTVDRARALTLQLLTFAKGGTPISRIDTLFPFIQETAQFALSGSNVSSSFDIPQDLRQCNFDKNQIGQVIDNIVINAKQAMSGGGSINLTARNVTLTAKQYPTLADGDYVKISIKDCGVGIPKEVLPRIFDPFYTTKAAGHGLGLATCYSIVNRHGGCIDVESEPGKGSTFHIFLPAAKDSVSPLPEATLKKHTGKGTFLVMDDEEVMQETFRDMLQMLGYVVECKENGKDAIEFVSSENKENRRMAGMIFDLTVPGGMGGKEAIGEIRKIDPETPIFVTSGYAEDPIMANPIKYGFTASICKPFRKSELSEMLNKYMDPKK